MRVQEGALGSSKMHAGLPLPRSTFLFFFFSFPPKDRKSRREDGATLWHALRQGKVVIGTLEDSLVVPGGR